MTACAVLPEVLRLPVIVLAVLTTVYVLIMFIREDATGGGLVPYTVLSSVEEEDDE